MQTGNEVILILNLLVTYSMVLLWFYLFDTKGLMCFTAIATIAANIEVLMVVNAFGMEQTLGNILFASTFVVTDILSETAGRKQAQTAVNIGILTSVTFVLISQSWLLYTPAETDWVFPSIRIVFTNTPRLMISSLIVYIVTQKLDVWTYHKWWALTEKLSGDRRRFLWLRNNASTLVSQFVNAFLFTFLAFYGIYDMETIGSIIFSSYIIFLATSLTDTPVVYLARYIADKKKKPK